MLRRITYELNFPFELFEKKNIKKKSKGELELTNALQNKDLEQITAKNEQKGNMEKLELNIIDKNQGFRPKNLNPVSFGSEGEIRTLDTRIMIPLL